jgi:hypothetical protein
VRIILATILFYFLAICGHADEVSVDRAVQIASNFACAHGLPGLNTKDVKVLDIIRAGSGAACYVLGFEGTGGFIVVPGRDAFSPVLAYSFESDYPAAGENAGFDILLHAYAALVGHSSNLTATDKVTSEWEFYLRYSGSSPVSPKGVAPLLTTYWGQSCYYNDSCPYDPSGNCYRARTGCGATAMSQIMKFHHHPQNGSGSHTYVHPAYGTLHADFESTYYDWANMTNYITGYSPPVNRAAIAQLMYHCGVAVEMDYGPAASSSFITSIRDALVERFRYSQEAQVLLQGFYPDSTWKTMLRRELDSLRPVFYAISAGTGGHFVVCDGYQDDDYFHFNWGNGLMAGYWNLLSELPVIQEAIVRIYPAQAPCGPLLVYEAKACRFGDGSNAGPYTGNLDCQWLISPPSASRVALVFSSLDTESGRDYLEVYDGNSTSSPLIGAWSGSNIPHPVISSSPSLLLRFTTTDSSTHDGWTVQYAAEYPALPASGLTVLTAPSGTFDDGSGALYYLNDADAYWLIKPTDASAITLTFNSFATEYACDFVKVYDGDYAGTSNLMGSFSGSTLPPAMSSSGGCLLLHFYTDFSTTLQGWSVTYQASFDSIRVNLRAFLEGPYSGTGMSTALNPGYLPLHHPYDDHPWNYFGTESVAAIPDTNLVDWVLVEIRETAGGPQSATPGTAIARQAAFLNSNGIITGTDGQPGLKYPVSVADDLYAVIWHRNHLGIMSASPLQLENGCYTCDFTTGSAQAFGGATGCREVGPGKWGMAGGDGDSDGQVTNADKIEVWMVQSGLSGYLEGDYNLDAQVNNEDKLDTWKPNSGMGCQVPGE